MFNTIWNGTKQACAIAYNFYQAEIIQSTLDVSKIAFGVLATGRIIHHYCLSDPSDENKDPTTQNWKIIASKIIDLVGNLCFIGAALLTRPAIRLWRKTATLILTTPRYTRLFGANGILPGDRLYLIISLALYILGLPSTIKTIYLFCCRSKQIASKALDTLRTHSFKEIKNMVEREIFLAMERLVQKIQSIFKQLTLFLLPSNTVSQAA